MSDGERREPQWMEPVDDYSDGFRSPTPSRTSSRSRSVTPPNSKERKRQRTHDTEAASARQSIPCRNSPPGIRMVRKVFGARSKAPPDAATSKESEPATSSIDPVFDRTILNPWREPYPKTLIPLGASGHDLLVWTNGATSYDGSWQFQIVKHGQTEPPVIPAQHKIHVAYFVETLGRWVSCGTRCLTGGHIAKPSEKVKVRFRNGLEVKFRLPGLPEDDVIQVPRPPAMPVGA
uniref:Uncharacterized protein n=1 Tax=Mycena chlorophos TaxID=658473 RepID=A0ABQ0L7D4_MYCCL|nr:predicted protein [Mycena chlorophos]